MRDLGDRIRQEINSKQIDLGFLIRMDFDSGIDRLWTGYRSLYHDTNGDNEVEEFLPFGDLLNISTIKESKDINLGGIEIKISGIPQSELDRFMNLQYQNRLIKLWLCLFNNNGNIIDSPKPIFRGFMDKAEFQESTDKIQIKIKSENIYTITRTDTGERWSDTEQKRKYPNDKGLEFYKEIRRDQNRWGVE